MNGMLLFLYAETPVHAGAAEALGAVDLPIQRDHTGVPTLWGQTVKGALRAHVDARRPDLVETMFGSEPPRRGSRAARLTRGWLAVGDARLVALPVATLQSTFTWVSSRELLGRAARLVAVAGGPAGAPGQIGRPIAAGRGVAPQNSTWVGTHAFGDLVVEVAADDDDVAGQWACWLADTAVPAADPAEVADPNGDDGGDDGGQPAADPFVCFRSRLRTGLVVLADGLLRELADTAVEVVARVQLDPNSKTAANLFFEELLPPDSLLVSYLRVAGTADSDEVEALVGLLDGQPLVLGGSETVGRGVLWARVAPTADTTATVGTNTDGGAVR